MVRVSYVGHATVLIEMGGVRLLTDPVLRGRVGHLRRRAGEHDPGHVESVDAVLVSHAHHDHLDVPSLRALTGAPRVICPAPAAGPVRKAGLDPEVVTAGGHAELGEVSVDVTEADHDGRRWPLPGRDRDAVGFVVRDAGEPSVYFAGDTGTEADFGAIGPVGVALIPVAGWGPKLGPGHIGPEEAAAAVAELGAEVAVPIHWGTYERVLMKATDRADPAHRFAAKVAELAPATRVELLQPGESLELGSGSA